MGNKGNQKSDKKKMTKKEKKAANHLKLVQSKKSKSEGQVQIEENKKKAA